MSFLQSPEWEQFLAVYGTPTVRTEQGILWQRRPLPRGNGYWWASRFSTLEPLQLPEHPGDWFSRVEPTTQASLTQLSGKLRATTAQQPRQTLLIDLYTDFEAAFHQKHRYNARLAEKRGVTVSWHGTDGLPELLELLTDTSERQAFRLHPPHYYQTLVEVLAPLGMARIGVARRENQALAALLLIQHQGTTTYLHGGSSHDGKRDMAPHLLQREAMRSAATQGNHTYDLWGTHAVEKNGTWSAGGDAAAGVTRFKLGFGGTILEYPGTFDVVHRPVAYGAYQIYRSLADRRRAFR